MSKHSHISAIFDNAFQSRAGSPDVYMSMVATAKVTFSNKSAPVLCKRNAVLLLFSAVFRPIRSSVNVVLNGLTAAKLDHYCGGFERKTRRVGLILTKLSFDKDLRSRCFDRFRQFADQVVIFISIFRN